MLRSIYAGLHGMNDVGDIGCSRRRSRSQIGFDQGNDVVEQDVGDIVHLEGVSSTEGKIPIPLLYR